MEEDKLRLLKLYNIQDLNFPWKLFLLGTKPGLGLKKLQTLFAKGTVCISMFSFQ